MRRHLVSGGHDVIRAEVSWPPDGDWGGWVDSWGRGGGGGGDPKGIVGGGGWERQNGSI